MRATVILGGLTAAAMAAVASASRDARACGGCFHEPIPPTQTGTVVTDHRMIFSVSPQQTTLYDQIKYSGAPSSFAWILPIRGAVTVGLSSDLLFAALDGATQTTINAPQLPACPAPSCPCPVPAPHGVSDATADAGAGVTILKQQVVGPYETVQLRPSSTADTAAVTDWLAANGYAVGGDQAIIKAYVNEGCDFLALRLKPGLGIQAMRPVSVTAPGAGVWLPLRMVAVGTGSTVGITLWVVGAGRYEPQNFGFFTIASSDLVWDWSLGSSNYAAVRDQKEAALSYATWQIESSLDVSPLQVEAVVLGGSAPVDYPAPPASDAGPPPSPDQARKQDLGTLFPAGSASVRVTRMRADLSRAALATDLFLQASADQHTLSNDYPVAQSVNVPACPQITCACRSSSDAGAGVGADTGAGAGADADADAGAGAGAGADAGVGVGAVSTGPTHESFSCSTTPVESAGTGLGLTLAALGLALARARRRKGFPS